MSAATPRVLHAPVEVAGQLALSAHALRGIGVDARSFARPHAYAYPVAPDVMPGPSRAAWLRAALQAVRDRDVAHFFFGQSFLPERLGALDARLLRRAGRRVVVEFLGSDVRVPSQEARRNPHYVRLEIEDDARATARMRRWSSVTSGHAIVCDRALTTFVAPHFAHVHVVPFRVDVQALAPAPPKPDARVPIVVHAPSDLAGKGTVHVRAAVEALRARGAELEYVELHGVSRAQAATVTARADLVIDQLCSGAHGVFAVEAMALAKPVLCHVLPEVERTYPEGFPIVVVTPETLTDVLADWLQRPRDRHERGLASRAYAERVHDLPAVARRLLDVYAQLPGRGG